MPNPNTNNQSQMQPTDNSHILKVNVLSVLKSGSAPLKMGMGAGPALVLWIAALPFSLIGAGIKTIVDITTRKKLTAAELDQTIEKIQKYDDEHLDQLVNKISSYKEHAKSNSSCIVYKQLELAGKDEKLQIENFKINAEEMMKQKHISEMKEKLRDKTENVIDPNYQVDFNLSYVLTKEDELEIENRVVKAHEQLKREKHLDQRSAILGFLREPYNAGKKLQHVIKDATEEIDVVGCNLK